jgi:hypothetical protein
MRNPSKSELVEYLENVDPDELMPPLPNQPLSA